MMDPATALKQEAVWMARGQATQEASQRAQAYRPRLGMHQYTCPKCWILRAQMSPMRSVPGTSEYDVLVCNTCDGDVVVPFD